MANKSENAKMVKKINMVKTFKMANMAKKLTS